jgi:hypothetical protein
MTPRIPDNVWSVVAPSWAATRCRPEIPPMMMRRRTKKRKTTRTGTKNRQSSENQTNSPPERCQLVRTCQAK